MYNGYNARKSVIFFQGVGGKKIRMNVKEEADKRVERWAEAVTGRSDQNFLEFSLYPKGNGNFVKNFKQRSELD